MRRIVRHLVVIVICSVMIVNYLVRVVKRLDKEAEDIKQGHQEKQYPVLIAVASGKNEMSPFVSASFVVMVIATSTA